MKEIIYRKEPARRFYLYSREDECADLEAEKERIKKEHPKWDVYIIENNDGEHDFITKVQI